MTPQLTELRTQREANFLMVVSLCAAIQTIHNVAEMIDLHSIAFFQLVGSARN
jgi:hypothetical protein